MPIILFIVDSGPKRGLGHLIRSISLAKELGQGNTIHIISNNDEKTLTPLEKTPFEFSLIDILDLKERERVLENIAPDIIITDLRSPEPKYLQLLKKKCVLLASIDDFNLSEYCSHLIFNGNAFAYKMDYNKTAKDSKLYLGPKYLILSKNFEFYNKKKRSIPERVKKVLVTFGGNDKNDLTVVAVNALYDIKGITIKVTLPPFSKERTLSKLKNFDVERSNIEIVDFIHDMPKELFNSDIVITGGGASLNEAVCIGTPCITIPQADYEVHNSEYLEEEGVVVSAGLSSEIDHQILKKAFMELATDWKKRISMSQKARAIIDGKGASRVAKTILKEFKKRVFL
jgi:spore coat polysaccharide biosynthesis predicted glycosyltransferase SpsG